MRGKEESNWLRQKIKATRALYEPNENQIRRIRQRIWMQEKESEEVKNGSWYGQKWWWIGVGGIIGVLLISGGWIQNQKLRFWKPIQIIKEVEKLPSRKLISAAEAVEKIRAQIAKLEDPNYIVHITRRQILYDDKGQVKEEISYDLWSDNGSARFKNEVFYPDDYVVQVHDGFKLISYDQKEKSVYIEHYVGVPKDGMVKEGQEVWLLGEFRQILKHQEKLTTLIGEYLNRRVFVLSYVDDQVRGVNNTPLKLYYEYYFDDEMRLKGIKVWRVRDSKKILLREVRIEKYEVIPREAQKLKEIFKFELPKDEDLKIYEVYRRADNLEMITVTPTPKVKNNEVQKGVVVGVTDKCVVMVGKGDKTLHFPTGFKAESKCYQFLTTTVYKDFNLNKNYVVYEAVDESNNTRIRMVIVEDEKVVDLVNLGKSWVFDMKFLPAGELVILYGDKMLNPTKQFVKGIRVSKLMTGYPDNIDPVLNQFQKINKYSNELELPLAPNKQESYELVKYEEGKIKVLMIGGRAGFEIKLEEFLP